MTRDASAVSAAGAAGAGSTANPANMARWLCTCRAARLGDLMRKTIKTRTDCITETREEFFMLVRDFIAAVCETFGRCWETESLVAERVIERLGQRLVEKVSEK